MTGRKLMAAGMLACALVGGFMVVIKPGARAADPTPCDWNAPWDTEAFPLTISPPQPNPRNDRTSETNLDVTLSYKDGCAHQPRASKDLAVHMVIDIGLESEVNPNSHYPEANYHYPLEFEAWLKRQDHRSTRAPDPPYGLVPFSTRIVRRYTIDYPGDQQPGSTQTASTSSATVLGLHTEAQTPYWVTVKVFFAHDDMDQAPPVDAAIFRNFTIPAVPCSRNELGLYDHPTNCVINGAMEWTIDKLLWLQDRYGPQALREPDPNNPGPPDPKKPGHSILDQVLTTGAAGDLTGLCRSLRPTGSSPPDCNGNIFAAALAPYAGILAMVLWGLSVLRSVHEPDGSPDPGATLGYLTHQMRTGLLTLAGVWLAYPASRFLWEMCSAGANAMVSDITRLNGGDGTLVAPIGTTSDFLAFPPWLELTYILVIVLEVFFVSIWMLGSTVAVLIGSIFGSFAVATGPMSGLGGMLGRWMHWMTRFYLLRLFLPPITAVLIGIMRVFLGAHGAGVHVALLGVSSIVFVIAIVWVTGQVVGFLMEGIAGAGRTIPGMLRMRLRG